MKKLLILLINICLFIGCSDNKRTLYVYNWSDYIDPEIIEKFEMDNNCRVVIDPFDDNETMLAKMLAGASGWSWPRPGSTARRSFPWTPSIPPFSSASWVPVTRARSRRSS